MTAGDGARLGSRGRSGDGASVAINLLWCVPGVGGSEEYLLRQIDGLMRVTHDLSLTVFVPRGFLRRHRALDEDRISVVEAPSDCTRRAMRVLLERTWLVRAVRDFDLVHHGGGTMSGAGKTTVLTIHDVQWCDYPEYFSAMKLRYLRRMVPSSVRRATRVAVPSDFVAGTLTKYFATNPARIDVVRHGLEPRTATVPTDETELRRRFGLGSRRVLLYPAITHPHKNHRFLLQLMSDPDSAWHDPDVVLVFAGGKGRADREVTEMITTAGLDGRVVRPGRVSAEDRDGLLALSEAMVFPSEYEGFGAPVIEAMRSGTPVICSDRGSLPGVAGSAALVLPLSVAAWAPALDRVRGDRASLVAAGLRRAEEFTSESSARDLLGCYEKALR